MLCYIISTWWSERKRGMEGREEVEDPMVGGYGEEGKMITQVGVGDVVGETSTGEQSEED